MMKLTLSPVLEKQLILGVLRGVVPLSLLSSDELSKDGKAVLRGIKLLIDSGASDLESGAVLLAATSLGADKEATRAYLRSFKDVAVGSDVEALGRAARSKEALVNLINEASEQLASGDLDAAKIETLLSSASIEPDSKPTILADEITDHFPDPPKGLTIRSLPKINEATNGLGGIWIIDGAPGLGKSTLGLQLALDIGKNHDVFFYDIDGTGKAWTIERIRTIVGGDVDTFKRVTARLRYRDQSRTIWSDLKTITEPALVVWDSIQALATQSVNYRRQTVDKWLGEAKELTKKGHSVLLISEVARSNYDAPSLSASKESGGIEYAGAIVVHLIGEPDEDAPIEFHVMKNRHGKRKGHIINLKRDAQRELWFNEAEREEFE
jgi:hypothetical protein